MLVEHVLGNPGVRKRVSQYCVGLAACCDPPDVEQGLLEYMSATTSVAHRVAECIALSLGLDRSYFEQRYTRDPLILQDIFQRYKRPDRVPPVVSRTAL